MREAGSAATQAVNVLDGIDATLRAIGKESFPLAPVVRPDEPCDSTVVIRAEADAPAVARALAAQDGIAAVERTPQRFAIRFEDERIAELGAALEVGDRAGAGMAADDLRAGEPFILDFCDPNATKALHVGHLRNIALGHAAAAALEAAGARVSRQSQIGDVGRSMGEAMAGYLSYAEGMTPASAGEKSDHFVGRLYARYVAETGIPVDDVSEEDIPVARDIDERDDLAQRLLARLDAGEPEAVALWRTIRGWAVEGQDATLARLGVRFDRPVFESDYQGGLDALLREALERGVVTRAESGALVFETGLEEYPQLPLSRADGFPTQNLRAMVMWHSFLRETPGATLIHVAGMEWRAHTIHMDTMLKRLHDGGPVYPSTHILHGMVGAEEGIVSSSKGASILIDDLLDGLVARAELQAIARPGQPSCAPDDLAATILLGLCLNRPLIKSLLFSPDKLLDGELNAGWRFAHAWAKACDPAHDGAPDPAPEDSSYRFVVMQSQLHRRMLAQAIDRLDVLLLVRFLAHLSEWYIAAPPDPRVGRLMRTTLGSGLAALGLVEDER